MKLTEFDYELPKGLIAQYPSERRGNDRLLVLDREKRVFEEKAFPDITGYFRKGDLLVLNRTKVIPARLFGKRKTGGKVEIFILDRTKLPVEALLRPSGRIKEGEEIVLESGDEVIVRERAAVGRLVDFKEPVDEVIKRAGHMPLPPYITRPDEPDDRVRYQTVYAKEEGATASPTAGLHFTEGMLDALRGLDVDIAYITLHVSYGTFAPVREDNVAKHDMHSEFYSVSKENVIILNEARNRKSRIFACGTTTVRALETCADDIVNFIPGAEKYGEAHINGFEGFTKLFIYPGYKFRITNALITNFHLPKSTLLLLTSAFAGRDFLFQAYKYAVEKKFRFFSYGDAMLII